MTVNGDMMPARTTMSSAPHSIKAISRSLRRGVPDVCCSTGNPEIQVYRNLPLDNSESDSCICFPILRASA